MLFCSLKFNKTQDNQSNKHFFSFFMSQLQWRIQDFPEESRQPPREAPAYYLTNFSRKLHENEDIWPKRRACVPRAPKIRHWTTMLRSWYLKLQMRLEDSWKEGTRTARSDVTMTSVSVILRNSSIVLVNRNKSCCLASLPGNVLFWSCFNFVWSR